MNILSFLPKTLKDILQYVSPLAFKTIAWKPLLRQASPLLTRINSQTGVDDLKKSLEKYLPKNIYFASHSLETNISNQIKHLNKSDQTALGEKLLELYFCQFRSDQGAFIDLRPNRFNFNDQNKQLLWHPNGIWIDFNKSFRDSMLQLYKGYYYKEDDWFNSALVNLGLVKPAATDDEVKNIRNLLFSHFGEGDQTEVTFSLKDFQASFHSLFSFLIKNRLTLDSDFLFLGIYLVTLYQNLELIDYPLNVRSSFSKAIPDDS